MIKISRETDYGIVLLTALVNLRQAVSAGELARRCGLPAPMVGKILKNLSHGSVLHSRRGSRGGYFLARPAAEITMTEVIEVLEGPIALTACAEHDDNSCEYSDHCQVTGHWNRINQAIRDALSSVTLAELSTLGDEANAATLSNVTAIIHPNDITVSRGVSRLASRTPRY